MTPEIGTPIIRDAKHKDINQMLPLLEQLFAIEEDFKFNSATQTQGLRMMLDGCGKHRVVKLACLDQQIIGMCTAQTRISTAQGRISAVLEDLVVDKRHRGRGIGHLLLAAIEDWAKTRGIASLGLLADKDNHQGLTFYEGQAWEGTKLICLVKSL